VLTVTATSGDIDTSASITIPTQYTALRFKSDGVDFWIF
jgi:hypothetical protein